MRAQRRPPLGRRALRIRAHGLLQKRRQAFLDREERRPKGAGCLWAQFILPPIAHSGVEYLRMVSVGGLNELKVAPRPKVFAIGETQSSV